MASSTGADESFKAELRNSLISTQDRTEQLNKIIAYVTRVIALNTARKAEDLRADDTFASLGVTEATATDIRNFVANELSLFLSKGMFQESHSIRSVAEYIQETLLSA